MSNIHHWLAHFVVCLAHLIILNSVLFFIFGVNIYLKIFYIILNCFEIFITNLIRLFLQLKI